MDNTIPPSDLPMNSPASVGVESNQYLNILDTLPELAVRFNHSAQVIWSNKRFHESVQPYDAESLMLDDVFVALNGEKINFDNLVNSSYKGEVFLISVYNKPLCEITCTKIITDSGDTELFVIARSLEKENHVLHSSQGFLESIIDSIPFLLFVTTLDGKYTLANKLFCDFVGMPKAAVLGKTSDVIFNKNISDFIERDNHKILKEKNLLHYESAFEINHTSISLSVDKIPVFDEQNNIVGICGVIEDVTSQYQLQKKLQQTQKMEAIGQLTGGIAHDFNNVLASIMGYAGLTKRRSSQYADETINGYLSQITRAGERAGDLVQQLLAFSRGDVGGLQILEPEPLAKESISMLSPLIPSSISLDLKIRNNNVKHYIEVDPVQFNQGLMNLVINAKDAIEEDTGKITVSLNYLPNVKGICDSCHTTFSGKFIQLSVQDTGTGISQDILRRIFDPFFTTKEIGKGSGMGLSMLHGIVHGSGGHIVVKSKNPHSQKGTLIQVYFPEVKSLKVQEEQAPYVAEKVINKNIGKSILVIDDELLITKYLSDMLENEGFNVTTFNSPVEGLEYLKANNNNVDLLITDQTMPELTGLELAKNIKQFDIMLPIILCTGYSGFAKDKINSESCINVILDKPFDDTSLLRHISTLISD
ncbi:MAG: response regulator [Woeseiaceae bacterium]